MFSKDIVQQDQNIMQTEEFLRARGRIPILVTSANNDIFQVGFGRLPMYLCLFQSREVCLTFQGLLLQREPSYCIKVWY